MELPGHLDHRVSQALQDFKDSKGLPAVPGQRDFQEALETSVRRDCEAFAAAREDRAFLETRATADCRDFQDQPEIRDLRVFQDSLELLDQAVSARHWMFQ